MVILHQIKKLMVPSSPSQIVSTASTTTASAAATNLYECNSSPSSGHHHQQQQHLKSSILDSFSSTSMISSNELLKERLDLKKKKQLSLTHSYSNMTTTTQIQLTPTTPTPTTPLSPLYHNNLNQHEKHGVGVHSPSRVGKQPRSRMQAIGGAPLKEEKKEEILSVFEACFAKECNSKDDLESKEKNTEEELKRFNDTLLAEYGKLRPAVVRIDSSADKTTVCFCSKVISLSLPHLSRKRRN